ncbi:protease SohB [Algiphilus aromaticivorans]|uniref:protease SohB n=1 Tax=Algiphilus aromaticivorans TaxID=382454 RepID=UPI0005C1D1F0|nr:protease SohB [Algiphilus aromaticivorans]
MSLFSDVGAFALKLLLFLALIGAFIALISRLTRSQQEEQPAPLEIHPLNERLRERADRLRLAVTPATQRKSVIKALKRQRKDENKAPAGQKTRPRGFVLDFEGDIRASAVSSLREEISALLQVADSGDEIILRLESPGGMVHSYGLAASQLARIRKRGIRLTVAVDKVAASGGYMMACVADRIIAAPFAVIGSIGVVMQLPNFHRLLKNKEIDYELLTAGEHKRTLTVFGENTDAARSKALEELEDTHALFKEFIHSYRPQLDLEAVASGEHWFGTRAAERQLVDELMTSDDYLLQRMGSHDLFRISLRQPKPLMQRLAERMQMRLRPLWQALGQHH